MSTIEAICMIVGALFIGIGGMYWYTKDKVVVSTGAGATFDLYWKTFCTFAAIGGGIGWFIGGILNELGVYIAAGLGIIAILLAVNADKMENAADKQKQYILAGVAGLLALGLFFTTGDNKKATKKPTVQQTTQYKETKKKEEIQDRESNENRKNTSSTEEKSLEKQIYELYGLIKNPYNEVPAELIDGSKYGFTKISKAEEEKAKAIINYNNLDLAIKSLKHLRLMSGGVPWGLLNTVIPPGRRLDNDDLRIGWIDIDEDISSAIGKLGEPYKIEDKNDEKIYFFGNPEFTDYKGAVMELTVKDSHVSSIISCGAGITTPRGISACGKLSSTIDASSSYHDTRADVMSYYGVIGYTTTDYEDMELIEYTVNSKKGQPCILRFAVNKADQYIYYISIRHK